MVPFQEYAGSFGVMLQKYAKLYGNYLAGNYKIDIVIYLPLSLSLLFYLQLIWP